MDKKNKLYNLLYDKSFITGILVFISFFVFNDIILFILSLFGISLYKLPIMTRQIVAIIISLILPTILVIIYRKSFIEGAKKIKKEFRKYIEVIIPAYFIGLAVMMFSNLAIQLFLDLPIASNEQEIRTLLSTLPIYTFISAALIGPLEEELIFRKGLKDVFKNNKLFIICSGLIFGSLHVITTLSTPLELFYIIPYSSLGVTFAYIYSKTDNIWCTVILHILHNTIILLIQMLTVI